MKKTPLVSIIVPTYNSAETLRDCLKAVESQTYKAIELIVVDNHSSDDTRDIAAEFTKHVFVKGPERSAQRNYGASKARGDYVCIIDSDMQLSPEVIAECVGVVQAQPEVKGVVIPEQSFGLGFWAACKRLERSFYIGVEWMEAARFFDAKVYKKLGGYDASLVSGEDWDLSQRVKDIAPLGRIHALIYHDEGQLKLGRTLSKKYYYAKLITHYLSKQTHAEHSAKQTSVSRRYMLFFSRPIQLFRNPFIGFGMLYMKTLEFAAGVAGVLVAKRDKKELADG